MFPLKKTLRVIQEKLRAVLSLKKEECLFLFIKNMSVNLGDTFERVYINQKDEDGFLYVTVCEYEAYGYLESNN